MRTLDGFAPGPFSLRRLSEEGRPCPNGFYHRPPPAGSMPLQESEVEPMEEIHPILEKMEHEKFYGLTEPYELTYGREFYADFQRNDDNKTLWLLVAKVLNLQTYLEVLVILGRLRTGRRKGEEEEEVNVAGHRVLGGPVVYYVRK